MVLGGRLPGRVGRRRISQLRGARKGPLFRFADRADRYSPADDTTPRISSGRIPTRPWGFGTGPTFRSQGGRRYGRRQTRRQLDGRSTARRQGSRAPSKGPKRTDRPSGSREARPDRSEGPTGWGGVARRGAGNLREDGPPSRGGTSRRGSGGTEPERRGSGGASGASQAWRQAVEAKRPERTHEPRAPKDLEQWILVEEIRDEAEHAVERATTEPTQRERAATGQEAGRRRDGLPQAAGPSRGAEPKREDREASPGRGP